MLVTVSSDGRGLPVTAGSTGIPVDVLPQGSPGGMPVTLVANGVPVQVLSGSLGGGPAANAVTYSGETVTYNGSDVTYG